MIDIELPSSYVEPPEETLTTIEGEALIADAAIHDYRSGYRSAEFTLTVCQQVIPHIIKLTREVRSEISGGEF